MLNTLGSRWSKPRHVAMTVAWRARPNLLPVPPACRLRQFVPRPVRELVGITQVAWETSILMEYGGIVMETIVKLLVIWMVVAVPVFVVQGPFRLAVIGFVLFVPVAAVGM